MLGGIGAQELLLILLVVLLLFGAKRIPEIAQGMGKGLKEFKKAVKDVKEEVDYPEPSSKPKIENKDKPDEPNQG